MFLPSLRRCAPLALSLCALSVSCVAIGQESTPGASGVWGIGIAAGVQRLPYAGIDNSRRLLPVLTYDNDDFSFYGIGADWKFAKTEHLAFALRGRYALADGYKAKDAPILAGMARRKPGFWAGGAVNWDADFATLSFELLGDASGNSKGTQARLGIERSFTAGQFIFTPRAAVAWVDKKYVGYYYGVRGAEATASRPTYEGDATVNVEVGLRTAYVLDARQSLFLDVGATALGTKIKNSPLVDKKTVPTLAVGYLYRF